MKKLKDLLKESYVWERKFGEKLPTLADVQKAKKINEVGMASDIKKYTKSIEKDIDKLAISIKKLKELLIRNGAKREAKELGSLFVMNVGKFNHWMKTKFIRMIRKLI